MGRQSKFEHHKDAVLRAIEDLTRKEGKSPSMRQIAVETGVSVATLHAYLKKLRAQGLIEWIEGKHRSLRVKQGALTAAGQGVTPPPPSAPTTPAAPPVPVPISSAPSYVPPIQVDETVDVGF